MTYLSTTTNGEKVIRYSAAETAQFIRTALKRAFPAVRFSVTSKTYSGGASVRVRWVDGPNDESVQAVVHRFAGASFDGMQDLKSYHDTTDATGQRVHYGADYVFTERRFSPAYLGKVAERVARYYRLPAPAIHVSDYDGSAWVDNRDGERPGGGRDTLGDLILQAARETAAA